MGFRLYSSVFVIVSLLCVAVGLAHAKTQPLDALGAGAAAVEANSSPVASSPAGNVKPNSFGVRPCGHAKA
jgi:hypothetical protein